jgi:hypothetical protein
MAAAAAADVALRAGSTACPPCPRLVCGRPAAAACPSPFHVFAFPSPWNTLSPPRVQKEHEGVCATALREVMLLKALGHPNVVSLEALHMHVPDLSLCLAFPYAETGAPLAAAAATPCWPLLASAACFLPVPTNEPVAGWPPLRSRPRSPPAAPGHSCRRSCCRSRSAALTHACTHTHIRPPRLQTSAIYTYAHKLAYIRISRCPVPRCSPPADLYDVIKHHRERGTAMLPHVFKSAMYQVGGVGVCVCVCVCVWVGGGGGGARGKGVCGWGGCARMWR